MDLFRELPSSVQRQARACLHAGRVEPWRGSCMADAHIRCGSWTPRCFDATPRRRFTAMQRRPPPSCASWTWRVAARACAACGMPLTRLAPAELPASAHTGAGRHCRCGTQPIRQARRHHRAPAARPAAQKPARRQRQHPAPDEAGASRAAPLHCAVVMLLFLAAQVGTSKRLYASVVNLCRAQYADQGTVALCSLRSQLLMALQDLALHGGLAAGTPYTELCEPDRCHRLAIVLDACVKVPRAALHLLLLLPPHWRIPLLRMATATTSGSRKFMASSRTLRRRLPRRRRQPSDLSRRLAAARPHRKPAASTATAARASAAPKTARCLGWRTPA